MFQNGEPVDLIRMLWCWLTTQQVCLNGWAGNIPEGTKHATVAGLWFYQRIAKFTFVVEHALIIEHGFRFLKSALRTGQCRLVFNRHSDVLLVTNAYTVIPINSANRGNGTVKFSGIS